MRLTCLIVLVALVFTACARSPRTRSGDDFEGEIRIPAEQLDAFGLEVPHYVVETRFRVVRNGRPRMLTAPKLAVQPGQRSNISVTNQVSFVQDFDAEVTEGASVVDPIIGIIQDGITLELLVTPVDGDPSSAWIGFEVNVADLREPIRQRTVRFTRRGAPGKVQLPKVAIARTAGVRKATTETILLLASLPAPDGEGRVEVLTTVRPVGDVTQPPTLEGDALSGLSLGTQPAVDPEGLLGMDAAAVDLHAMVSEARSATHDNASVVIEFVTVNRLLPLNVPMNERAAQALIQGRARLVERLKITSAPVLGARTASLLQTSYLQDYDVVVPEGHKANEPLTKGWPVVADPLIGTMVSGRDAWLTTGDEGVRVHVRWAWPSAMPDFEADLRTGPTVTIELPELRFFEAHTELREGRWLLPLGKTIRDDRTQTVCVWIDYRPGK